jgi:hypothetical protein
MRAGNWILDNPSTTVMIDPETQAALKELSDSLPDDDGKSEGRKTLDDLVSRALAYRTGPELKELFAFTKRFPHLAPYNAMLLHVQNPGIRFALRAAVWERKYERRVSPGARPYVILQTMGPVAFVFDVSDTKPIDPLRDRVPEIITNPFPAKGQVPAGAFQKIMVACVALGILVRAADLATELAGFVQLTEKETTPFCVMLNSKHNEAQRLGTLAHELAHVFCGHLGELPVGFWADRRNTTTIVREFEAEAVAYFVTDRLNLDIGSVQYLAGYLSSENPLPNYSLDAVLKAAGKIEDMLHGRFRIKKARQSQS